MYEVYTGSKPGRPTLLLVLSGVALIGSLGLAWAQTQRKLSLGPPQALPGTPMVVQPPRGWIAIPERPGVFVQRGDQHRGLQRCVVFSYARYPHFRPPVEVIRNWDWAGDELRGLRDQPRLERLQGTPPTPTTLAGWSGLEIRARRQVQVLTSQNLPDFGYAEDRVLRVACHPRGDVIAVEYIPAVEVAAGDLQLLNALSESIEFNDAALRLCGPAAMKAAGVQFPVDPDWRVLGPDFVQAPGVRVLGADREGKPAWAIAICRTWLSNSRSAADVVADHVAARIGEPINPVRVIEWGRLDGVRVAELTVPKGPGMYGPVVAYLLWKPPQDAVLISVDGEMQRGTQLYALSAAEKLAETCTFAALDGWPDVEAAQNCGRECAATFSQSGGQAWWENAATQPFLGLVAGGAAARLESHQALENDRKRGFSGGSAYVSRKASYFVRDRWTVDGSGVAYTWNMKHGRGDEILPGMAEFRRHDSNVVTRRRGKEAEYTFTVGDRFVCPPLESLAEAWTARSGTGECLIDVSSYEGRGITSRLIRRLPGEKTGPPPVIVIDDYAPRGRLAAYDDKMNKLFERGPGWQMDRVDPSEVTGNELIDNLRRLMKD